MRLSDVIDPKRGPALLVKLALMPLIAVVACQVITLMICRLSIVDMFLGFLFLIAVSPVAYWIREHRRGYSRREARRGVERTPVLPHDQEENQ